MPDELPWFKIYAQQTLADSNFSGWSLEERGAFLTLLLHNWLDGQLPTDQTSLARLLRVDHGTMRGLWSALGSRFIPHPDRPGFLTNPRLEKEREAAHRLAEKRGTAGKKGATTRWDKEKKRHSKRIANASVSHEVAMPIASPSQCGCHTDPAIGLGQGSGQGLDLETANQTKPTGRLADLDSGLVSVAKKLGAAYGRPGPLGAGKDWNRVLSSFGRWLETVGEDALVTECLRLAAEQGVQPSHLSWWPGWLDTVSDADLRRAATR